jgi:hypothetical protein
VKHGRKVIKFLRKIPEIPDFVSPVSLSDVKCDIRFNSVTFGYDISKVILNISLLGLKHD